MEKESSKNKVAFVPPQKSSVFFFDKSKQNESGLRNGLFWHFQNCDPARGCARTWQVFLGDRESAKLIF